MIDIRIYGVGQYELLNDVSVSVNEWNITVYKGFTWDGASIPQNLWDELGCPLDYAFESLIHDALYRTHLLDRRTADMLFYLSLVANGVPKVKARTMYYALRLAGGKAWKEGMLLRAKYRDLVLVEPMV